MLQDLTLWDTNAESKQIRQQLRHHPDKPFSLAIIMTDTIHFPRSLLN